MPKPTPPIPKADARKLVLEGRKELNAGEILDKSERIFQRLIEVDDFVYAKKFWHMFLVNRAKKILFKLTCY
jgi:hypothetical protein